MKNFLKLVLCLTLVLGGAVNLAFADASVTDKDNKAKLYFSHGGKIQKFLNSDGSVKDGTDTNISVTIEKDKNGKETASMNGEFVYNGVKYEVEADGLAKTYVSKKNWKDNYW